MPYPSTVGTFSNPIPSDKLNSPSHSSIETAQNTAITEIETFVGTIASTAGTLMYDVRSVNSNGGGHVQSANKGGTGQTSFTKGDILVAQSSSVITKVAIGSNGEALVADSSRATGVKWAVATVPTMKTIIPPSMLPVDPSLADPVTSFTLQSSILGYVGQINVPFQIEVNKVRFSTVANQATTSILVGIYSEDGQTQKLTATFNAAASVQTAQVSSVILNGIYYIVTTTTQGELSTAAVGMWSTQGNGTVIDKLQGLPGSPVIEGTIAVTAGALPATINPLTITSILGRTLVVRLDN